MIGNAIAKLALNQLKDFMKKENINQLKVWVNENGDIDFSPVHHPDELILKSEHLRELKKVKDIFIKQ